MKPKFKKGDMLEVINYGLGCSPREMGKKVTIIEIGEYGEDIGYKVCPPIGNTKTEEFDGFIGEKSFKLIKHATWKSRYE